MACPKQDVKRQKQMEEIKRDVNLAPESQEQVVEDVKTPPQEAVVSEETTAKPAPHAGDRTDPNLLLKSLKEEKEKRRKLEEELDIIKSSALSDDEVMSDEGRILAGKIKVLESALADVKTDSAKKDVLIAHPILKEKWDEFEEFRSDPENKGMNLRTAAKAYLIENGMLDVPRKGLEKPTGGPRVPVTSGMSAEDIDNLRKNDEKKFYSMLKKGQIKFSE